MCLCVPGEAGGWAALPVFLSTPSLPSGALCPARRAEQPTAGVRPPDRVPCVGPGRNPSADPALLSQPQDHITITGYEKNTEAARDAILKIVGELEQMVSEDVPLDHRVHARIIGARGKAIRKIMDEFKVRPQQPARLVEGPWGFRLGSARTRLQTGSRGVGRGRSGCACSFQVDIRFPQSGAPDPNCVTVTGLPENVEEAIDHILNLEEEYVSPGGTVGRGWGRAGQGPPRQTDAHPPACPRPQLADVVDTEALQLYMKPPAHEEAKAPSRGFVVRDAPWTASSSEKVSLCRRPGLASPGRVRAAPP